MKKKTMTLVLIAVAITVALVCIVGVIIKSPEPPPITSPSVTPTPPVTQPSETPPPVTRPPKSENVEIKLNETVLVKGNSIKLISIEEEKGIVKIEVQNETTGEPMVVPLSLQDVGAFMYNNIGFFLSKIEDNRVTLSIAYYEEDMRSQ